MNDESQAKMEEICSQSSHQTKEENNRVEQSRDKMRQDKKRRNEKSRGRGEGNKDEEVAESLLAEDEAVCY